MAVAFALVLTGGGGVLTEAGGLGPAALAV